MNYELHPLCTFFPRMEGKEYESLKEDLKANGQAHPIILHQGMILDGGNRYRALIEIGAEPSFIDYEGDDPTGFVLSCNLHRRHLAPGQSAAIVAAAQDWGKAQTRGGDRKTDQSATLHFDLAEDRAETSGASLRTQKMADKLVKEAPPELVKEVTTGKKSLPKALREIKTTGVNAAAMEAIGAKKAEAKAVESEMLAAYGIDDGTIPEHEAPEDDDGKTVAKWRYDRLKQDYHRAKSLAEMWERDAAKYKAMAEEAESRIEYMEGELGQMAEHVADFAEIERLAKAEDKGAEAADIIREQGERIRRMEGRIESMQHDGAILARELEWRRKHMKKEEKKKNHIEDPFPMQGGSHVQ